MNSFRVAQVRVGRPQPFGPAGRVSAIHKASVDGPVLLTATGFEGDEVGDQRHHGGPDKAVHAYPHAHYAAWRAEIPDAADRFCAGGFGENLVIDEATESDVCLGDRWQVGTSLLEVSQGRQPCWKLNVRFGPPDMARRVQSSGRTGWYFRVLETGEVAAGARGVLVERPHPDWPISRVARVLYRDVLDYASLESLAALPGLPERWRSMAERRIAAGNVEDWRPRLDTPG